jgi:hypothetical protein
LPNGPGRGRRLKKDGSALPNGAVVASIELPGVASLYYAALGMSEPLSKLAVLWAVSTKWYVYDETARTEVTTLFPGRAENWNTPIGQFGVEAGSTISISPWRRRKAHF